MWVDPSSLSSSLSRFTAARTYIRLPSVFTGVSIIDARTWYTHIGSTRVMVRGDRAGSIQIIDYGAPALIFLCAPLFLNRLNILSLNLINLAIQVIASKAQPLSAENENLLSTKSLRADIALIWLFISAQNISFLYTYTVSSLHDAIFFLSEHIMFLETSLYSRIDMYKDSAEYTDILSWKL